MVKDVVSRLGTRSWLGLALASLLWVPPGCGGPGFEPPWANDSESDTGGGVTTGGGPATGGTTSGGTASGGESASSGGAFTPRSGGSLSTGGTASEGGGDGAPPNAPTDAGITDGDAGTPDDDSGTDMPTSI